MSLAHVLALTIWYELVFNWLSFEDKKKINYETILIFYHELKRIHQQCQGSILEGRDKLSYDKIIKELKEEGFEDTYWKTGREVSWWLKSWVGGSEQYEKLTSFSPACRNFAGQYAGGELHDTMTIMPNEKLQDQVLLFFSKYLSSIARD